MDIKDISVEDFQKLFPDRSDENTQKILSALADLKGSVFMVSQEQQALDAAANALRDKVDQVVEFVVSKEAADKAALDSANASLADAQASLASMTAVDAADKAALADAQTALADAQQQIADLKAGDVSAVGALGQISGALDAIGKPAEPIPPTPVIDVPPPVEVPPPAEEPPADSGGPVE